MRQDRSRISRPVERYHLRDRSVRDRIYRENNQLNQEIRDAAEAYFNELEGEHN